MLETLDKELVLSKLAVMSGVTVPKLKTTPALKIDACPKLADLVFPEFGPVQTLWLLQLPALTSLVGFAKLHVSGQVSVCVSSLFPVRYSMNSRASTR